MCRSRAGFVQRTSVLLAVLLLGVAERGTAQSDAAQTSPGVAVARPDSGREVRRAELHALIDSLVAEQRHIVRRIHEQAGEVTERTAVVTDTVIVGPFLFVNRTRPPAAAVAALDHAWRRHEAMAGGAVRRLTGAVVTLDLGAGELPGPGEAVRLYRLSPPLGARAGFASGATHVIATALVDLMPDTLRTWVRGGALFDENAMVWAYRDLATTSSLPGRACFARDLAACTLALTGEAWNLTHPTTRTSLLQHALALGGAGAYERLLSNAPDIATRLSSAAGRPIDVVIASWRAEVEGARPRVHAGVARAGLWTVVWLIGLALLAMRSTRWRLG